MRKFLVVPVLVVMLLVFAGFLTNCPVVNQPNNLCQGLVYGSDLWAECSGLYGSDGTDAEPDTPDAIAVDAPDDDDTDDDTDDDDCEDEGPTRGPSTSPY